MARIQNKLLTGTIIVIHLEKEVSVVKDIADIKENIEKSSEVAPLDGIQTSFNHFNTSFATGIFPEKLKFAKVIPIHKKDSKLPK